MAFIPGMVRKGGVNLKPTMARPPNPSPQHPSTLKESVELKIQIDYVTGDSFSHEDKTEEFDLVWSDMRIAKQNLKAIQEHYSLYLLLNKNTDASEKQKAEALSKAKNKFWFVDNSYWEYSLNLKEDNGESVKIDVHWIGYFESLTSAEIILANTKIKF